MSYARPMEAFFRAAAPVRAASRTTRSLRGQAAYSSGLRAEDLAADYYRARGCEVLSQRWRGPYGEIDLILRQGGMLVFVEVKKSASHDRAALRISRRQIRRICYSALDYCGRYGNGWSTDMRFDAALVDAGGNVTVIGNAFSLDTDEMV